MKPAFKGLVEEDSTGKNWEGAAKEENQEVRGEENGLPCLGMLLRASHLNTFDPFSLSSKQDLGVYKIC